MSNKAKKRPQRPASAQLREVKNNTMAEDVAEPGISLPPSEGPEGGGYEIQAANMVMVLKVKLQQERERADVLEAGVMQLQEELAQARATIDRLMEGREHAEDEAAPAGHQG